MPGILFKILLKNLKQAGGGAFLCPNTHFRHYITVKLTNRNSKDCFVKFFE